MSNLISGVLKLTSKGSGTLRDLNRSLQADPRDVRVPSNLVRQFGLAEGALLEGTIKAKSKGRELGEIVSVCGGTPEAFANRKAFTELTAVDPCERFNLAITGNPSMRVVDLLAPIGKGTRGLIVSPPKAGKTMILEQIANSIHAENPDTRIIVLLIDERPEEVTHFRRAVQAEALASTSDQTMKQHIELAELTLAHIRLELQCGREVVVLVDSLTRMGRAFNQKGPGRGRTLSGGLDAGALEIPRRFFGAARNVEDGGSVTIIATALVDTGSRMDQHIFQEFKGTGNSEIVLDRTLADARVFPAINVQETGTRKEEMLYPPEHLEKIARLRRVLSDMSPKQAMEVLTTQLAKFPDNEAFLDNISKGR